MQIAENKLISDDSAIIWDESVALKRLDGDRELLSEMIKLFIKDAPDRLSELTFGLENSDGKVVADAAHAIKGMAGHFCAKDLAHQAAQLEHFALLGEAADIRLKASVVENEIHRLINALKHSERTQK